jgi:hypothetical protein
VIIFNPYQNILGWESKQHGNLFKLKVHTSSIIDAGAHVCAPVFGQVPHTDKWKEVTLPQHGFYPQVHNADRILCKTNQAGAQVSRREYVANEGYPWGFAVEVTVKEQNLSETFLGLQHSIKITRDQNCKNPRPMPLSYGWHPFFTTGERFSLAINGRIDLTEDDRVDPRVTYDLFRQTITLKTMRTVMELEFAGYQELLVSSADKTKYLCLVPVRGRLQPDLLLRGESSECSCSITVTNLI